MLSHTGVKILSQVSDGSDYNENIRKTRKEQQKQWVSHVHWEEAILRYCDIATKDE
jgi:hypothetical protein